MMYIKNGKAEGIKLAYIGGGSRGWAWNFMSDLASAGDMSGDVYLYDIDYDAAAANEIIGNRYNTCEGCLSHWDYHAARTPAEALTGADFVIISILPGTFDEMGSDIHTPEAYGIYQSVGDTTGPGGIVRAMRTVPMYEEIAGYIMTYCPHAWVINYTNPMTLCVRTLYRVFPEIKAFGCCHEVFGTQHLLMGVLAEGRGLSGLQRSEIKVNPVGVNHFTWLTSAHYQDIDIFPIYRAFAAKYAQDGHTKGYPADWRSNTFQSSQKVKLDLFNRYGYIAAAGDRHLAEFCEGGWYLKDPETVYEWGFGLTPISFRKKELLGRLKASHDLRNGTTPVKLKKTGEEGVHQMRAILGLCDELVTNVNMPNIGQIPNLPRGAVVETNAVFRAGSVTPVMAGDIPVSIYPLIARICGQQESLNQALAARDLNAVFAVFVNDPLVTCSMADAKSLFSEMLDNTKTYLGSYDLISFR